MEKIHSNPPTSIAETTISSPPIGRGMTLVMAFGCGAAVANIYYNQPMLRIMEATFPGRLSMAGLVATATQLGFAAGTRQDRHVGARHQTAGGLSWRH
jgi:hypothetical protein